MGAFYRLIAPIFDKISDRHCRASLPHSEGATHAVGPKKKGTPFEIEYRQVAGKGVLLLIIKRFLPRESSEWAGLLEKMDALLPKASAIILDLRDNPGGDDGMGRRIAERLYGSQDFPLPVKEILRYHHPIPYIMRANLCLFQCKKMEKRGLDASLMKKRHKDFLEKAKKFKKADPPLIPEVFPKVALPLLRHKKPIFILINRGTGSAAENMVDFLEAHPHATTIGERSAGGLHFGNFGFVCLPYSGICITLGTQFRRYHDGRMIEEKGITPDKEVPQEKALLYVLSSLRKKWGAIQSKKYP